MVIIGSDFHARCQQIAMLDEAVGQLTERRLDHRKEEADAFYRNLQGPVRVGIGPPGRSAGSSACSRNWVTNFGSATPPRFRLGGSRTISDSDLQEQGCRRFGDILSASHPRREIWARSRLSRSRQQLNAEVNGIDQMRKRGSNKGSLTGVVFDLHRPYQISP
jgi:hypothetical protein